MTINQKDYLPDNFSKVESYIFIFSYLSLNCLRLIFEIDLARRGWQGMAGKNQNTTLMTTTNARAENEPNQERFELSKRQDSETITNLHKQLNAKISSENDSITTLSETFKYLQKKNSALPGLNSNTDRTSLDDKIASLRIENNFVDNRIHSLTRPNISAMDRELENRSDFDKELSSDEKIINYEKK